MNLDSATITTLGNSLCFIDPTLMKGGAAVAQGDRMWFQGGEPYFDIIIETHDGTITWFQITLRGRVLSWHRDHNQVQTGETDEMDTPPLVAYYAASKTIRDGAAVDWCLVKTLQEIVAVREDAPLLHQLSELLQAQLSEHLVPAEEEET
ncbi:MAG: hypothetical protein O3A14_08435 [Cyanobacteria bacterium]|nr:hypothetical protein [Cyanobacteriota bacterium]